MDLLITVILIGICTNRVVEFWRFAHIFSGCRKWLKTHSLYGVSKYLTDPFHLSYIVATIAAILATAGVASLTFWSFPLLALGGVFVANAAASFIRSNMMAKEDAEKVVNPQNPQKVILDSLLGMLEVALGMLETASQPAEDEDEDAAEDEEELVADLFEEDGIVVEADVDASTDENDSSVSSQYVDDSSSSSELSEK